MPEIDEFEKMAGTLGVTRDQISRIAKALREVHDRAVEGCAKFISDTYFTHHVYESEHERGNRVAESVRRLKKSNS